jgi:hypothetical protein
VWLQVNLLVLGSNTADVVAEAVNIPGVAKVLFANNAVSVSVFPVNSSTTMWSCDCIL